MSSGAGHQPIKERWRGLGRVRLDIAAMQANPVLAASLEDAARRLPHVSATKASAVSGSLLVSFNAESSPPNHADTVRVEIEAWLDSHREDVGRSLGSPQQTALRRMLDVSRGRRGQFAGPVLLTVGAHSLATLQGLSLAAIGTVAQGSTPNVLRWLGVTQPRSKVRALTATTVMLTAVSLWGNYRRRRSWQVLSQATEHRLRNEVFAHLQRQDLAYFQTHGTGELLAMLVDDEANIGTLVEEADMLIESVLTLLFAATALVEASPRLAVIAGLTVPLLLVPVRLLTPRSQLAFSEKAGSAAALNETLDNILSGIVEVKSFTAEKLEAERVLQLSEDLGEINVQANSYTQLQTMFGGNIFHGGYTLAMSHGAKRVLSGMMPEDQLTRAGFWYPRLISSLGRISGTTNAYYAARTSADRLQKVLDTRPKVTDGPVRRTTTEVLGDIRFENVTFGYDSAVPVLHNLSLEVPAGSTLAIVGPTGCGKSTLLRLILRFYDPDSGTIRLDGYDLRDVNIRDLRSAVALVSQEVYLFNGSVRHNVLYGRPSASDADVIGALAAAGAGELLEVLPQGLDQEVGERGQRLSGGQRQRVAIARALLKGAPILALDEATSQLDYATEATVKASLRSATAGITVIYVAHRLTTIRDADNIIVLENGTVGEQGTHESLLDQGGLYAHLWRLQA